MYKLNSKVIDAFINRILGIWSEVTPENVMDIAY